MSSLGTAPVDARQPPRQNVTATERFAQQRELFTAVARAYVACRQAPVISASRLNPAEATYGAVGSLDTPNRTIRWTPNVAHYICDVELAVRKALELKPEAERPALRDAWERLLEDDSRVDAIQRRAIQLLAGSFYRRELHPREYFRPNRHPQKRGAR